MIFLVWGEAMLEVSGLYFKDVLEDINLTFDEGKINVIIGQNGCGKSVLFKCILGLLKKTKGDITLDDVKKTKEAPYFKNTGALIEEPDFHEYNSGYDNLRYLASINNNLDEKYILELLERFNLTKDRNKLVKFYSLGMKKKLGIIQAIMENQRLIILDEPTNGLDKKSKLIFYDLMKELKEQKKIILIASHIDSDIKEIADRVIKIDKGKIVEDNNV